MAVLTVRNLPDEVHSALRVLANRHCRSMEAEVRDILTTADSPAPGARGALRQAGCEQSTWPSSLPVVGLDACIAGDCMQRGKSACLRVA